MPRLIAIRFIQNHPVFHQRRNSKVDIIRLYNKVKILYKERKVEIKEGDIYRLLSY